MPACSLGPGVPPKLQPKRLFSLFTSNKNKSKPESEIHCEISFLEKRALGTGKAA